LREVNAVGQALRLPGVDVNWKAVGWQANRPPYNCECHGTLALRFHFGNHR
jgi:hypothetical protein